MADKFDWGKASQTAWDNTKDDITSMFGEDKEAAAKGLQGTLGKASAGIGALGSFVEAAKGNATLKDTTGIEAGMDALANTDFTGDNTALLSQFDNTNFDNGDYQGSDLTASTGTQLKNTGSAMLSGAAAGAKVGGPWGAVIGGAAGLLSGIGGSIAGAFNAKEKARKLREQAAKANRMAMMNFNDAVDDTAQDYNLNAMRNIAALGGQFTNGGVFNPLGIRTINEGGTHEQNPNQGVLQGYDPQGVPNLVEEGEVVYNDYVFSNRLKPSKEELKAVGLPEKYFGKNVTFADIANKMNKGLEERPNDNIAKRTAEDALSKLQQCQETQKQRQQAAEALMQLGQFACGGKLKATGGNLFDGVTGPSFMTPVINPLMTQEGFSTAIRANNIFNPQPSPTVDLLGASKYQRKPIATNLQSELNIQTPLPQGPAIQMPTGATTEAGQTKLVNPNLPKGSVSRQSPTLYNTTGRYAPVVGNAIAALAGAFEKPDYSDIDKTVSEAYARTPERVQARTLNNYVNYTPQDINVGLNALRNQGAAHRRALQNTGNAGAASAALLAQNWNAGNNVGQALQQIGQYNNGQRQAVAGFNRGTDQYNAGALTAADQYNSGMQNKYDTTVLGALQNAAQQKYAIKNLLDTQKSTNINGLLTSLGNIGKENWLLNDANTNQTHRGYVKNADGSISYIGQ